MKTLWGKRILWVLLIPALLAAVFFVGRMTVRSSALTPRIIPLPDGGPYQVDQFWLVMQRILQRPGYELDSIAAVSNEDLQEVVSHLILMDNPSELGYRVDLLCHALPLERIFFILKYILTLDSTPDREVLLQAFLEGWSRIDPESALAFASRKGASMDHMGAIDAVLRGWAKEDVFAAWNAVLMSRTRHETKVRRLQQILDWALNGGDVKKASELISKVGSGPLRDELQAYMAYLSSDHNQLRDAIEMALSIENSDRRLDALVILSRKWAEYDPQQAIAWAGNISDPYTLSAVLVSISEGWASYNPELTADWTLGLEGALRSDCIEAVINVWLSQEDDGVVASWLFSHIDGPEFDPAIITYVEFLSDYDYEEAMNWAMMLYDDDTRVYTVSQLADEWLDYDSDMATDYIRNQDDMSDEFKALLLGEAWVPQAEETESEEIIIPEEIVPPEEASSNDMDDEALEVYRDEDAEDIYETDPIEDTFEEPLQEEVLPRNENGA